MTLKWGHVTIGTALSLAILKRKHNVYIANIWFNRGILEQSKLS